MGGRITVEAVVRCSWNGLPDDRGIRNAGSLRMLHDRYWMCGCSEFRLHLFLVFGIPRWCSSRPKLRARSALP
ncbi:hypothetical protein FVE88_19210 [Ectopseudomonas mendocina]|nr:hypothetical protein FVE88_19210 [Pseudomonas mendocina]